MRNKQRSRKLTSKNNNAFEQARPRTVQPYQVNVDFLKMLDHSTNYQPYSSQSIFSGDTTTINSGKQRVKLQRDGRPGITWNLLGIYLESTWNLLGIYLVFTWILLGIYLELLGVTWNNSELLGITWNNLEFTWYFTGILSIF